MKKIVLLCAAALMISVGTTYGQKVDVAAFEAKAAKSNTDIAHAKKSLKASTWVNRGNLYKDALLEPAKALYVGIDMNTVKVMLGGAGKSSGSKTFGSKTFNVSEYNYLTIYESDGKANAWRVKKAALKDAQKEAMAAYDKAYELDPGSAGDILKGLKQMEEYYKLIGTLALEYNDMKVGANSYGMVNKIQSHPAYNDVDPAILFYAGYMLTIDGDNNPASFAMGETSLKKAVEAGYDALEDADEKIDSKERGNIYYYLFHCAYAMKDKNPAKLQEAKVYLQTGVEKYPLNEKIFEGLLQLYTGSDKVGDPKELLGTIEKSIEADPKSMNAWFGRGRIYFALKNYDECIESFKHVVEIDPKFFEGNYYLGLFYMLRGDNFLDKMKETTYTDQASYNKDSAQLNALYADAIPCFEAAHAVKPTDYSTLEYLKQLCFRLRDEPGVMDKYTKYNDLFKALPPQE